MATRDFFCATFSVKPTNYTTATVTWATPTGAWNYQRLVRNFVDVPVDVSDGVAMFTDINVGQLRTSFDDTGLISGRRVYYALFVFDPATNLWRKSGGAGALLGKQWGYTRHLYNLLPEALKAQDFNSVGDARNDETTTFLYRFLDVFGYQLDYLRSETEDIRTLLDARRTPGALLPAYAESYGVKYEPTINARALRRYVQNAVHLYGLKGTAKGTQQLSNIITGWASVVSQGYNLALDDADAGPSGSQGRWQGVGGVVTYVPNTGALNGPAGTGVLHFVVTAATNAASMNMNRGTTPRTRLLYAIPAVAGTQYTVSQYLRSTTPSSAAMSIVWLDQTGTPIGAAVTGAAVALQNAWAAGSRPFVTATAPAGAAYLEASVALTGAMTANQDIFASGFLVQTGNAVSRWQPARQVLIKLRADLINEVIYPTPKPGSAGNAPWTATGGVAPTYGQSPTNDIAFRTTATGAVVDVVPNGGPLTVAPGDQLQLNGEAQVTTAGSSFSLVARTTLANATVVDTVLAGPTVVTAASWVPLTGQYTAPANAASVQLVLRFTGAAATQVLHWRRGGLIRTPVPVDYFDGGTVTPTQDDVWQGLEYASRTHRYFQRSARAYRLRQQLIDYLPNGLASALQFASPT